MELILKVYHTPIQAGLLNCSDLSNNTYKFIIVIVKH